RSRRASTRTRLGRTTRPCADADPPPPLRRAVAESASTPSESAPFRMVRAVDDRMLAQPLAAEHGRWPLPRSLAPGDMAQRQRQSTAVQRSGGPLPVGGDGEAAGGRGWESARRTQRARGTRAGSGRTERESLRVGGGGGRWRRRGRGGRGGGGRG